MFNFSFFSRQHPKSRGQGLVEFALVAPILLVMILGIIEVARLLAVFSTLSNASRQAARYSSVAGSQNSVPFYLNCDGLRGIARSSSPLVSLSTSDIFIGYDEGDGKIFAECSQGVEPTDSDGNGLENGDRIVVSITTTFKPIVSLIPIPALPLTFVSARTIFKTINGPTPTASCTGTPGSVNALKSDAAASSSSAAADGTTTVTITVSLLDAEGCPRGGGDSVTISHDSTSPAGMANTIVGSATGTTNSSDTIIFVVKSSEIGQVTYKVVAAGVTLSDKPVVSFTSGGPSLVKSSIESNRTTVPADGTLVYITVTVRDALSNTLPGYAVSLISSRNPSATPDYITTTQGTSDSNGRAFFIASSGNEGSAIMQSSIPTMTLQSKTITFSGVSSSNSTASASPSSVTVQDGTPATSNKSMIVVKVRDDANSPVSGKTVTITCISTCGTTYPYIQTVTGVSASDGGATFTVNSTLAGTSSFQVVAGGATLQTNVDVIFTAGPVVTLTITPSNTTVLSGGAENFVASATDTYKNSVTLTNTTWAHNLSSGSLSGTGGAGSFTTGTTVEAGKKITVTNNVNGVQASATISVVCLSIGDLVVPSATSLFGYFILQNPTSYVAEVSRITMTAASLSSGAKLSAYHLNNAPPATANVIWSDTNGQNLNFPLGVPDVSAWGTGSRLTGTGSPSSPNVKYLYVYFTKDAITSINLTIDFNLSSGAFSCRISK